MAKRKNKGYTSYKRKVYTGKDIADHYADAEIKKTDWTAKKQMKKKWNQTDEHRKWLSGFSAKWRNKVIRTNVKKANKQMKSGLKDYRNTKFINEE